MCIDICPVGALTSGAYRYKTRPWEMKHVGTVCTHCGDGCKTTLGVRRSETGMEIVRGDNRDKSGINGDFLCIKGRYAFDFANHEERLTQPLIRKNGKLIPATWEEAFELIGKKFTEVRDKDGGTRDRRDRLEPHHQRRERICCQKFARVVLKTNNIDHHRTADFPAFAAALRGKADATASMRDVFTAPAILLIGNDPTDQHPLLAWQIRNNVRLHRAKLYVINSQDDQAAPSGHRRLRRFQQERKAKWRLSWRRRCGLRGARIRAKMHGSPFATNSAASRTSSSFSVPRFAATTSQAWSRSALAIPGAKFVCLGDYANSRGAADMGLYPDLLPGYHPIAGNQRNSTQEWGEIPQAAPGSICRG